MIAIPLIASLAFALLDDGRTVHDVPGILEALFANPMLFERGGDLGHERGLFLAHGDRFYQIFVEAWTPACLEDLDEPTAADARARGLAWSDDLAHRVRDLLAVGYEDFAARYDEEGLYGVSFGVREISRAAFLEVKEVEEDAVLVPARGRSPTLPEKEHQRSESYQVDWWQESAGEALKDLAYDLFDTNDLRFFDLEPGEDDEEDDLSADERRAKEEVEVDLVVAEMLDWFQIRPEDPVLHFHFLWIIDPALRGRGLGQALARQVEVEARRRGCKAILLQSGQIDSEHSLEFWKKLGYQIIQGDYSWYEDRLMIKVLR